MSITLADIEAAAHAIADRVENTPLVHSRTLSKISGAEVYLKLENLQFTASFKERGALNKLLSLSDQQRAQGVFTMSAGNHAQALAYHAQQLGIHATIVMPLLTPNIKVEHTRSYNAEVILHGDNFDAAADYVSQLQQQRELVLVHPYDDEKVIAGQGTIALEMLAVRPELDTLIIPVGGGGLIAGNAIAARAIKPGINIIGVEAQRFSAVHDALHNQSSQFGLNTIAEGIAVKQPGKLTLPLVKTLVDEIVLVDENIIEDAVLSLLEVEKTVAEGAGAVGLAALMQQRDRFAGQTVGIIISGGNIDMPILSNIIQRGLVKSQRLVRLRIELRDVPGSLARITRLIENSGANIEHIHHHRTFSSQSVQMVDVEFVLHTRGETHASEIRKLLTREGFSIEHSLP